MLAVFAANGMYPFGDISIAWSDGIGQVVPMLAVFKDVLDGQSSLFLNFQISGGANFYGIFLFFLASPFSLLVKLVDKGNLPGFFNVLIALKMAAAAFTAAYCLTCLRKKLDIFWVVLFSLTYSFCGYVMMYYLIMIWLDMAYLFPLLIVGLHRLTKERQPLLFIAVLAVSCMVSYYITYMLGIFILLYTGGYLMLNYREKDCSRVCRQILLSSLLAFLLSAVFWLPSFMQYQTSARGEKTIVQTIASKKLFLHRYETSLPLLLAQALPWVLILRGLISRRQRSQEHNLYLLLLALTLIPFVVEPINLLWHTGNYMCFPCRFSFITIFLALLCSAYTVEEEAIKEQESGKLAAYGSIVLGLLLLGGGAWGIASVLNSNISAIGKYVATLWADAQSIKYLSCFFLTIFTLYSLAYWAYWRRLFSKNVLFVFLGCIFCLELLVNSDVYFVHCARIHEKSNRAKVAAYDLCRRIEDSEFYRVKSRQSFHSANCIGSLGYNSLASYTSLNDHEYMKVMKRFGYSGAWMGTSSYGGTELTDALLSVKYEINGKGQEKREIYSSAAGSIVSLPYSLPMGVFLKKGALEKAEYLPEKLERADIQSFLSQHVVGEDIVQRYRPKQAIKKSQGFYNIKKGTRAEYDVRVNEETSLYLDMFDRFSTRLSNPLYEAAEIRVNGKKLRDKYPNKKHNGLLYLGTYEDTSVKVSLRFKKKVKCRSFGLFGLEVGKLKEYCRNAQGADLHVQGSGLSGRCSTPEDCSLFVSVPYSDSFTIKVNGEKTDYKRAFADFLVFDLPKGENEISIEFIPKGLKLGGVISCLGLLLSVCYIKLSLRLENMLGDDKATKIITAAICSVAVLGVYVLPVLVKVFK